MLRKTWFHVLVLAVVFGVSWVWLPWLADKGGPPGDAPAGGASVVDQAEAERLAVIPDALACPCGMDAVCKGPMGGVYCVDVEGRKRYKPKG